MAVRLLLDENLSERLVPRLADVFPSSAHVRSLGQSGASDHWVWRMARTNGFILVTRDQDFVTLSVLRGAPPKVIWLNVGNARTAAIELMLRIRANDIERFSAHEEYSFLAIGGSP